MKCHFSMNTVQMGVLDLDKKLPFIKNYFPNSTFEKKSFAETDYIVIRDVFDNVKLISFNETDCEINLNADLYTTSLFGYSFLDINFDITEKMVDDLTPFNLLFNSMMSFNEKNQSVSTLFSSLLFKYFESEKTIELVAREQFMDVNRENVEKMRAKVFDKIGFKYFFTTTNPAMGIQGGPGSIIIEDYDHKISINNDWRDIGDKKEVVYEKQSCAGKMFLLRNKKHFKELHEAARNIERRKNLIYISKRLCKWWMEAINKQISEIRKSIAYDNNNQYYWKELKKNIEIMDLNFLEFHTVVIGECTEITKFPSTKDLEFSIDFVEDYNKEIRKNTELVIQFLNEVKYAIRNLSTPGHTHDEHLLQEETEKVHERLLMISFIAMAIPCGVAIMSPGISMIYKIIAASAIFSIPLIYFIIRKVQKILAFKRNVKSEMRRLYTAGLNSIKESKEAQKLMDKLEGFPDDIKKEINALNQKGIEAQERRLSMLKKRI